MFKRIGTIGQWKDEGKWSKNAGRFSIGMKRPQRNIIGKRKKLENVCASNTSLAETAMKRPRKVEVTAISSTLTETRNQFIPDRSTIKRAKRTGTKALIIPKSIAPVVFASIRSLRLMGARSKRSNDLLFRSKVIVTASIDVVPKRTERAITPGKMSLISTSLPDRTKNMRSMR
ncbi:hypothetical protein BG32_08040 [Mesotoga sp. HF07.pep.5.2.highcov]|nr:hypothetical protein BG32_08040 [Mesotoga sp. HF07.pep.5.2.highcov]